MEADDSGAVPSLLYTELKALDYILSRPRDRARMLTILWQFGKLDLVSARKLVEEELLVDALWSGRQLMDKIVVIRLILEERYHFMPSRSINRLLPSERRFLERLHRANGEDPAEVGACLEELDRLYQETGKLIEKAFHVTLWREGQPMPGPDED